MNRHVFVAMPFGKKFGHDGVEVDFDRVYAELIRPALENAGCRVFRADEEQQAGDIRTDMFQELLVSDLVVADLTLDNPNVWYELGVRHALRARGVVLIQGPRPYQPFDIYTDRKLRYTLKDGAPDPATLEQESVRLTDMARATLDSASARKISPVYALLPHLQEPDWRTLELNRHNEFFERYREWAGRVNIARRKRLPGNILVLAEETPTYALTLEARRTAGNSLLATGDFGFALEQFGTALKVDPEDIESRQKRAICLGRVGRSEEAREVLDRLSEQYPNDAETCALQGRIAKEDWLKRWQRPGANPDQMRTDAAAADAHLHEAIMRYRQAFRLAPSHYYSGINALVLSVLREHLSGRTEPEKTDMVRAGIRWALGCALEHQRDDYWALASLAEARLVDPQPELAVDDWRAATVGAQGRYFELDSSRQTLHMLRDLGYRPKETAACLAVLEAEIKASEPPFIPRQVFLFSGHMMDAPGRKSPRFPPALEGVVAQRISETLDAAGAGPEDIAFSQAAAGSDLLFLEACAERGLRSHVLLPFAEPEFIQRSILPSIDGEGWRGRWLALRGKLAQAPRIMPEELGPAPDGASPYERCNRWLLYTALAWGQEKVRFICLWNGGAGDGPGGTAHMYEEVNRRTGQVTWIDSRTLKES